MPVGCGEGARPWDSRCAPDARRHPVSVLPPHRGCAIPPLVLKRQTITRAAHVERNPFCHNALEIRRFITVLVGPHAALPPNGRRIVQRGRADVRAQRARRPQQHRRHPAGRLGRPVTRESDDVAVDLAAEAVGGGGPPAQWVVVQVPQSAQQRHEAVRVAEVIGEIEVSGQLAPGPARDLYVVAAEPQNVLQRHAFGLIELFLLKNGVDDIWPAVVGAGVQAGHHALVLGVTRTGRGRPRRSHSAGSSFAV